MYRINIGNVFIVTIIEDRKSPSLFMPTNITHVPTVPCQHVSQSSF